MTDNFGKFRKGDLVAIREESTWAPVATGTWCVSADELRLMGMRQLFPSCLGQCDMGPNNAGMKGRGVDIVHCMGDHLWLLGDGRVPDAPPASAAQALQEYERRGREARETAAAQAAQAMRAAEEAARQQQLEEIPRAIRRKEKALRQIGELQEQVDAGHVVPDDDQRNKLAKAAALRDEIAAMQDQLSRLMAAPAEMGDHTAEGPGIDPGEESGSEDDGDGDVDVDAVAVGLGACGLEDSEVETPAGIWMNAAVLGCRHYHNYRPRLWRRGYHGRSAQAGTTDRFAHKH